MRRLPLCVLVLALGSPPVGAQGHRPVAPPEAMVAPTPRYQRTQSPPAPVQLSARVKPSVLPAAGPAATPANPRPSVDVAKVLELESAVSWRPEQEQILVQLILNTPDSEIEEKTDYHFRLATLYANGQRFWMAKASDPKAADTAKTFLLKAVKAFKALTDNEAFRNYPKMDLALFRYGYALQTGKYMKEARAVYDKLLKSYPNSKYVPNAHLGFAEYYYDAGQFTDAEARYKEVMKFPRSNVYWYAFYKTAWIHLQLQRHQDAIDAFARVVFATRTDFKQNFLYEAAKRELVHAYAAIGKVEKSFDAFSRLDKEGAAELVLVLADHARERGEIDTAIGAYGQLIARAPKDRRLCTWQYRLAHGLLSASTATAADKLGAIEELVNVYARHRAALAADADASINDAIPGIDTECRENAAAMSGELALAYHSEWSKTRNATTLDAALRLYAKHTATFPSEPLRKAFAEAAWSRAALELDPKQRVTRWQLAASAFARLTSIEDLRAASLAWLNAMDYVPPDAKLRLARTPARIPKPLPFKPGEAAITTAMASFITLATTATTNPQPVGDPARLTEELVVVRLGLATMLRASRRFDQATDVLDHLLEDHPEHAHAELAAHLLLDSMVQAKNDNLPAVVAAMLADRAFIATKPHLVANLTALRARR